MPARNRGRSALLRGRGPECWRPGGAGGRVTSGGERNTGKQVSLNSVGSGGPSS